LDEGDDLRALPVEAIPSPARALLGADKGPELIKFEVTDAVRRLRLRDLGSRRTQDLEHRGRADQKYSRRVADAATVKGQRDDQTTDRLETSEVRVVSDELEATVFAPVALFSIGSQAILLNNARGAGRA